MQLTRDNNITRIFDYLIYPETRKPNIACLVILFDEKTQTEVKRTVTDINGYYEFIIEDLPVSKYTLQFYGSNTKPKLKPDGDWEIFENVNADKVRADGNYIGDVYLKNPVPEGDDIPLLVDGKFVDVYNHKKVIWSAYNLADSSYNSSISANPDQLFFNNSHSSGYLSKFYVRYVKQAGDRFVILKIFPNFVLTSSLFNSPGILAARFLLDGGSVPDDTDLSELEELIVDISGNNVGEAYDFVFQVKRTGTIASDIAIRLNEVFII